jgi:hypothetical protein
MGTLICKCGKEKSSTQKKICDECRIESKRKCARKSAQNHRKKYGSKINRGPYCSRCKGVKEHQDRGYCAACERARYLEKSKPDCATCGKIKENVRDAYCHECKNERSRLKSFIEDRRPKNKEGRKTTCSHCGREKEGSYLNESYCAHCKYYKKKLLRPYRSDEQKLKDAARKLAYKKIMEGSLVRQPCEVCEEIKVDAHHDDYSKPFDVRWLCKKHHREHHDREKDEQNQ